MSFLRVLSRRSFVLRELVRRDLQGRYAGSALGFAWSFVQPLWQLALFTFVFAVVLKVPLVGERAPNFAVFLFAGLLPWIAFNETVQRATSAILDNATLVKRLSFPSEILIVALALSTLVHQGIAAAVFAAILAVRGELFWPGLPLLLPALAAQLALTLGLSLLVSALQVFLRDTAQLVGIVLGAWFYLTPIVYPLGLVPEPLRRLVELNPLAGLVGLYRSAFLGSGLPSRSGLLALALAAAALLAAGATVFRRLRVRFPDEI